jgi:hypothetical protein
MQFINTSGQILMLRLTPSFTVDELDLTQPFGLIQREQSIRVELRALPAGLDAWFFRLDAPSN